MFKDKLKNFINGNKENSSKRKIENLVFLIILLIITIVLINYIWNDKKDSNKTVTNSNGKKLASESVKNSSDGEDSSNNLERRLEDILKQMQGIENAKVFLNYSESSETVAMFNENSKTSVTEETDTSGGKRKVEETDSDKEIVYKEENGNKTPIVQKKVEPKIEGAIITAKGASNVNIKTNIIEAVEAVTGLATHKIQVFEMQ